MASFKTNLFMKHNHKALKYECYLNRAPTNGDQQEKIAKI